MPSKTTLPPPEQTGGKARRILPATSLSLSPGMSRLSKDGRDAFDLTGCIRESVAGEGFGGLPPLGKRAGRRATGSDPGGLHEYPGDHEIETLIPQEACDSGSDPWGNTRGRDVLPFVVCLGFLAVQAAAHSRMAAISSCGAQVLER